MVQVKTSPTLENPNGGRGHGTGFYVTPNRIMTNWHVVNGQTKAGDPREPIVTIKYRDGKVVPAKVLYSSSLVDLAIIEPLGEPNRTIEPLEFCAESNMKLGTKIVTIGHPLGFEWMASEGIISRNNFQRPWTTNLAPMIITDNKIYQGNSGGPMITVAGCVAGVSVQLYNRDGQIYSLSISGDFIKKYFNEFLDHTFSLPMIGFKVKEDNEVVEIVAGSEAEKMGLLIGDKVLKINYIPVDKYSKFVESLLSVKKGEVYTVNISRNGQSVLLTGVSEIRRK